MSYGVFSLAFVPLIFGGKIYNAVEKVMVTKIVLVLGYLTCSGVYTPTKASLEDRSASPTSLLY